MADTDNLTRNLTKPAQAIEKTKKKLGDKGGVNSQLDPPVANNSSHMNDPISLRSLAFAALATVAGDPTAPPAARASAARTLLEATGALRPSADPTVAAGSPSGMTLAELDAAIAALSRPKA